MLPPGSALGPVLEAALHEQHRLTSQLGKISRIGDRYQDQLRALNQELTRTNARLSQALAEVKTLQGFIPICARCKRIRDDDGYWGQIEAYICKHSEAVFSHGVCPECAEVLFPGIHPGTSGPQGPPAAHPTEETVLEARLEQLAQDPALHGDPLADELGALTRRHLRLLRRQGKIVRISDGYQNQLKQLNIALIQASNTDLLTGLANRRAMMERIQGELDRSDRGYARPSLLMVDVDHFKQVNDGFGHEVGDRVLQALARALGSALRGYDLCARWGGEEFLVLLPETGPEQALGVGEKIRLAAGQAGEDPALPAITLSVGVAARRRGETLTSLVQRADDAMYEAKRLGRNQVQAAPR
jgi:diguanylate cyclase (GGDEF)-like protein